MAFKRVIFSFLLILSVLSFSNVNWSININLNFGAPQNIPDYSILIDTGVSFVDVYIDDVYAGQTDIFGQLLVNFDTSGYHTITIKDEDYLNISVLVFVDKTGKYLKIPLVEAGKLVVFSNTYPVNVYINGYYYGTIRSIDEEIKLPEREHFVTFESPGYNPITKKVYIKFEEKGAVNLNFEKLKLELNIRSKINEFSPNNDWYMDRWELEIYLSTYATLTVDILKDDIKIFERVFSGKPYLNLFTWDGSGASEVGEYLVKVIANDGNDEIVKETKVLLDDKYTYLKEIAITSLIMMFGTILYFVLKK